MRRLLLTLGTALALGLVSELVAEEVLHHDAEAIANARAGMEKEIPVTKTDPNRPVYHFLPEARWINDPNGAFFADGWYHVFYQHNPYGNGWGHMHWGHARSRDNVTWERLPVGVWPCTEKGELRLRRSEDGTRSLAITYENGVLDAFGTKVEIAPEGDLKTISLQVFLDKSIVEVFVNGGKKTVARVMFPPLEDQGIEAFTDGKGSVDVWQMKSIWEN